MLRVDVNRADFGFWILDFGFWILDFGLFFGSGLCLLWTGTIQNRKSKIQNHLASMRLADDA
jgi:hypothetical protein